MSEHPPTDEQRTAIEAFDTGLSMALDALAGTGKTTTLEMLGSSTRRPGAYMAFNKSIAAEASMRMPANVEARTVHSYAYRAVGHRFSRRIRSSGRMSGDQLARALHLWDPYVVHYGSQRKVIQPSTLAGHAMRAVKRFCQTDDPVPTREHVAYIDGIDLPTGKGERTWENNDRVREMLEPVLARIWADLQDPDGSLPYQHDAYLKIWAAGDPQMGVSFLMVDECFPAGTLIETSDGPVPVEQIAAEPERAWMVATLEGDSIGYAPVRTAYRTPRRGHLVRVVHEHGSVIATADHPFIVGDALVPAVDLPVGAPLFSMPATPARQGQVRGRRLADVLLAGLRLRVPAVEQPRGGRQDARGVAPQRAGEPWSQAADAGGTHETPQPDAAGRRALASVGVAAGHGPQAAGAGRERETDAGAAAAVVGGARERLGGRACRPVWRKPWIGTAVPLEGRPCEPAENAGGRMRRVVAFSAEPAGGGPAQGRGPGISRVVRVEVLEPGDHGLAGGGGEADHVYTLEVASASHSYFADGVAVGNCQDLSRVMLQVAEKQRDCQLVFVGDANQSIYSWRGSIDAMQVADVDLRATLTQSFRFGQPVADVANWCLGHLPTELRVRGFDKVSSWLAPVDEPAAVLTRTNAGSLETLFAESDRGRRAHLVGGGSEVESFARAARDLMGGRGTGHPELACFDNWAQVVEYTENDPQGDELALMVRLVNTYGTERILSSLERMPREADADVVVSTAHKAKGREWSTVRVHGDFRRPDAGAAGFEEWRLLYVAATRAQHGLDVTVCPAFAEMLALPAERRQPAIPLPPVSEALTAGCDIDGKTSSADVTPPELVGSRSAQSILDLLKGGGA